MLRVEYEVKNRRILLRDLSAQTGLNRPLLSNILRGRVTPTKHELAQIATRIVRL